ncbi:sensor histidine kinase [Flavobacterium sp.]|uniref:sensor histidine kinase n=1 Tax=Flavobacterium sp. TaxID=239 RepID=UPI00374DADB2
MKLYPIKEELKERVKELTCLYEIANIISKSNCEEKTTLKKIISSTKKAWKYNIDATVELHVSGYGFSTSKIEKQTISQISHISIAGINVGFIKVHYSQNKYTESDFLKNEQKLLDNIAFEIGNYIEKFQNIKKKQLLTQTVERTDILYVLGEMTAGIAHELNTPLGNILGYAELIKSNNQDPEIDADISTVISSVICSREIVKKLMLFSCEMPKQLQLKEIKPIIIFALSLLKQNFLEKNIKSEIIFKNDNIIARIDTVQITKVLLNLIINAIHASPVQTVIKTVIESDSGNLLISIEDQGTGIADAIKHKIFEPFFSTKPTNNGCGLGLSLVHKIVKNHNGKITVLNNNPTGTIFVIKLPLN